MNVLLVTTQSGQRLVFGSFAEGRLAIADYDARRLLRVISLRAPADRAVAYHPETDRLVTGYDTQGASCEVRSLHNPDVCRAVRGAPVVDVRIDESGRYAILWPHGRLLNFDSGRTTPILRLPNLLGSTLDRTRNLLIVPRGTLAPPASLAIEFSPFRVLQLSTPHCAPIVTAMRFSPDSRHLIAISQTSRSVGHEAGRIQCFEDLREPALWTVAWEGDARPSYIGFSGNGRAIALRQNDRNQVTILSAQTGSLIGVVAGAAPAEFPWDADSAMCADGTILNLQALTVEPGVSSPRWWRAAGL